MAPKKFSYKPNTPVPPGDTLLEVLQFLKMSQKELSERMGRPLKLINEIVKGKTTITTETAIQLERVLGKEASFWLQLEAGYQEAKARKLEREDLSAEVSAATAYPYKEMVKFNWIEDAVNPLDQTQNLLSFFGVNSIENIFEKRLLEPVAYKISTKKRVDNFALEAWLRKGTIDAQQKETAPFSREVLESKVPLLRALNRESPKVFEDKISEHLAEAGISFVITRSLTNVPVNGASRWLGGDKALIQLTIYGKTADKFWFSLFHEIGHILLHGKRFASVDLAIAELATSSAEAEANEYSKNILIPHDVYKTFVSKRDFSDLSIKAFANRLKVLPGIVVGRLQYEGFLPFNKGNNLKNSYVWADEQ